MAFTDAYIETQLLRAQRAMLIISERIQSKFLYLQSSIMEELQYKQRDIYCLWDTLTNEFDWHTSLENYDALVNVLIWKCQEVDAFNTQYNTINPNYVDISGDGTVVVTTRTVEQTGVVFPGDGILTYTFPELIGKDVLAVYRGTGTTLRAHAFAPDNEFAQFNSSTGAITVSYAFANLESLWVQYLSD